LSLTYSLLAVMRIGRQYAITTTEFTVEDQHLSKYS